MNVLIPEELDVEEAVMDEPPLPPGLQLGSEHATDIFSSTDEPDVEAVPPTRIGTPMADPAAAPLNQALHRSVDALDGIPSASLQREHSRSPPPMDPRHQPAAAPDGLEARAFVSFLARRTAKKSAAAVQRSSTTTSLTRHVSQRC